MYYLRDFKTKERVEAKNFIFAGEKGPWEVAIDLDEVKAHVNFEYFRKLPPYVSKYLSFLPIKSFSDFVSLGEGATPLIRSKQLGPELGIELYFKLESQNPTGSFKDRGSAVELSVARELGVKGITVASTGNMAASCSCYAAAAKIPCFVFVPEETPASKLSQVIAYGGRIVQVKGGYNDAVVLARDVAEKLNFYLAGDYAYRVEGQKTAAFEILDQLYFNVPTTIIIPIGCGTNMTAYGKGFREYQELGFIDRIPKLVGVEAEGAKAVVNSFLKRSNEIEPLTKVNTIASAIAVADPLDGVKALEAIYATKGSALAVTDREMLEAQYRLAKEEGLFVESSAAASIAALLKLAQWQSIEGEKIVCVLTGGGLKDPSTILKVSIRPPTIRPNVTDFLELYNNSFFDGNNVAFVDRDEVIFSKEPTPNDLGSALKKYFNTSFSGDYVNRMQHIISKFLKKGKPITFADLQDTVQDALEAVSKKSKVAFVVQDFTVKTGKDRKAEANVTVRINGSEHAGSGEGVGPVDAVINALKVACGKSIEFALAGYKVNIRSQGTDAVVYVELKVVQGGVVSVGRGTSPDIIQASIEAFEEAYNGF